MNWRYLVGKSLSEIGNCILSSKVMPLTRVIPLGLNYPYDIKRFYKNRQVRTILDVGANVGQTSLFLNRHFPSADIFAFEPVKATYELLKANSKNLEKIHPSHYALGAKEHQRMIRLRENSELNTLVNSSNCLILESEKVETITVKTINDFCQSKKISNIDILKMDVQGYEIEVLQGAEYYLKNHLVSFIYCEIGFDSSNKECQHFEDLNNFLNKNKFCLSGFYEVFRWGEGKKYFGFCNALFINQYI